MKILAARLRDRRCGVILVTALWILMLLVFLALNLNYRVRLGMSTTSYRQDRLNSESLLRAGLARGLWAIRQDQDAKIDSGNDAWSAPIDLEKENLLSSTAIDPEGASVLVRVTDESARINVNTAPKKVLDLLFRNLYGSEVDHQALADCIADWVDKDDDGNAEKDYYQSLAAPYLPRNDAMKDLQELLAVRGVTQSLYDGEDANGNGVLDDNEDDGSTRTPDDNHDGQLQPGLKDVLTVVGEGEINVNTAPVVVLASVFGAINLIDESKADQIAAAIEKSRCGPDGITGTSDDTPFKDAAELAKVIKQETDINIINQCRENLHLPLVVKSAGFRIDVHVAMKAENIKVHGGASVPRKDDQPFLAWWRLQR